MVEDREEKRITVRVSPEMYEKVSAVARAKNMSVNGFIITALEHAVDPDGMESRLALVEAKLRYLTERP